MKFILSTCLNNLASRQAHSVRLSVAGVYLFLAATCPAAVLVQYSFDTETLAPSSVGGGLTASNITVRPQDIALGLGGIYSFPSAGPDEYLNYSPAGSSNEAGAVADESYFAFTLTPGVGYTLDLDTITFDLRKGGSSGTRGTFLRSSIDGFAATVAGPFNATSTTTFDFVTFTLPNTASYNDVTTPITFRLYAYDGGGNYSRSLQYDDITVNGTATIPEPHTVGLLVGALGIFGIAFSRRRKRCPVVS